MPDARFLLLFRSPAEAIDSLYRRGDEAFALKPAYAIDVWMAYNRRVLAFHQAHPDRCQLVDAASAVAAPDKLVATVCARWQLPLKEPQGVVEQGLFRRVVSQDRRAVVAAVQPAAWELYTALRAAAGDVAPERRESAQKALPTVALAEWARASALEARVGFLEAEARTASAAMDAMRAARDALAAELESIGGRPPRSRMPFRRKIVREASRVFRGRSGDKALSSGHQAFPSPPISVPLPGVQRRSAA